MADVYDDEHRQWIMQNITPSKVRLYHSLDALFIRVLMYESFCMAYTFEIA